MGCCSLPPSPHHSPLPLLFFSNLYYCSTLRRFHRSAAEKILQEVLEEKMAFCNERDKKGRLSFAWDSEACHEMISEIVGDCQKKVVDMMRTQSEGDPRYKFVVQASMGENQNQMVRNASRCLWDDKTDNCASAQWTNGKVYAVAMCFALYYE